MTNKNKQGFKITVEIPNMQGKDMRAIVGVAQNALKSVLPYSLMEFSPLAELGSNQPRSVIWDTKTQALMINSVEIRLNRMEQVIMTVLSERPNEFVSYPELLAVIQTNAKDINSASNLRVLIHRLRRKIGVESGIQTDKQFGYSLRTNDRQIQIR